MELKEIVDLYFAQPLDKILSGPKDKLAVGIELWTAQWL
jgi:hypothetical protein